jgi:hypothetical protein
MRIKYRGNWFDITATPGALIIACDECALQATKVGFREKVYGLRPGETLTFDLGKEK